MKCPFEHRKYDFLSRCTGTPRLTAPSITGYLLVTEIPWGFGNAKDIGREAVALRHVRYFYLLRLIKPHVNDIMLSKIIISQTDCEIT